MKSALCMGMALSTPSKGGFLTRIRRKILAYHGRHHHHNAKRPATPTTTATTNEKVDDAPPSELQIVDEVAPEQPPTVEFPLDAEVLVQEHGNLNPRESQIIAATIFDSDDELDSPQPENRQSAPLPPLPTASPAPIRVAIPPELEEALEWKWILNLSMHFRDRTQREKFFITFAETKTRRRRLTVSIDYRDAPEGSLEWELKQQRTQRDKSVKIFEAIRDSLDAIMFFDTITNLKLQTSDGRLHVHVTEDAQEVIHFPPVRAISHLRCPKFKESELKFDSHLSGFVYKVLVDGEILIKKEIPGPDTVDEFLYEINALYALRESESVIRFKGCVVDEAGEQIQGLLISFAPNGALIDTLYNEAGKLTWHVRERWAKQIVNGLSDIHEAGYVQGDFTLSNIVIDHGNAAKIIDINRRGCPVGWEPPEVTEMVDAGQRIGMYIGVKSDIYQLGMVLWAIAHEIDEPDLERERRPLDMREAPEDVPDWFGHLIMRCLSPSPQGRPSAKDALEMFPELTITDDDDTVMVERPESEVGSSIGGGVRIREQSHD